MFGIFRAGFLALFALMFAHSSYADITCTGTIDRLYKNTELDGMSIQLIYSDNTKSPFVRLPSKSDEAMALLAFGTGKVVSLSWVAGSGPDVTACNSTAWLPNLPFEGYFLVKNN